MRLLILILLPFLALCSFAQNTFPLGYWYGQLEIVGTKHELLLLVSPQYHQKSGKPLKGKYILELLNPEDSSTFPVKVHPVSIDSKKFVFSIQDLNLKFSGMPSADFQKVDGTFEQSGLTAPLSFGRSRFKLQKSNRPQTPQPPFSYHQREVKIPHIKENFSLAGTLTLPEDTTNSFPIVIMASGSGPQDRDEEILGHRLFWVLADHLAKNGIGSLRFDDRGVGASGGVFSQASLQGFSEDVESVLQYLRDRPIHVNNPIGILGHSEGAMHAWMVAKRRSDVDFIISLAGPAVSGGEIIEQQQYDIGLLQSQEQANWSRELFRMVNYIIVQNPDPKAAQKALEKFIRTHHKKASETIQKQNPLSVLLLNIPKAFNNSWGREFMLWNPDDYLPYYSGKVLYIIGEKDLQVNAEMNFNNFLKYISLYEKESLGALIMDQLNHLLQTCKTCTIEEYGSLEETISMRVLNEIVVFLKK